MQIYTWSEQVYIYTGCIFAHVQINFYIYAIAFTCPKYTRVQIIHIRGVFDKFEDNIDNTLIPKKESLNNIIIRNLDLLWTYCIKIIVIK